MVVTDDGRRDSLLALDAESLPQAAGQAHANMQPKLERLPCARVQEFRDAILPLFRRVLPDGVMARTIRGYVDAMAMRNRTRQGKMLSDGQNRS